MKIRWGREGKCYFKTGTAKEDFKQPYLWVREEMKFMPHLSGSWSEPSEAGFELEYCSSLKLGRGWGRSFLPIFASPPTHFQAFIFWNPPITINVVSIPRPLQQPKQARKGEIEKILLLSLFFRRWMGWEKHQAALFFNCFLSFPLMWNAGPGDACYPRPEAQERVLIHIPWFACFWIGGNEKKTTPPRAVFKVFLKDWSLETMGMWKPLRVESHCQSKW